jgi:hypothetical protein
MNGAVCQLEQLFITKSEEGVGPTAPCISYTLAGKLKKASPSVFKYLSLFSIKII